MEHWSISFSISPSNEYSGLISFRIDWFDLLAVQGTLKSLVQHHSLKASIIQFSVFFRVQFSHPHMTTGKTIAFDHVDLCQQSDVWFLIHYFFHSFSSKEQASCPLHFYYAHQPEKIILSFSLLCPKAPYPPITVETSNKHLTSVLLPSIDFTRKVHLHSSGTKCSKCKSLACLSCH